MRASQQVQDQDDEKFTKDRFQRYKDPELELQYMEFVQPQVSASLVVLFLLLVPTFAIIYRSSDEARANHGALPNILGVASIIAPSVAAAWQVALVVTNRCFSSARVGQLNKQSEWLLLIAAIFPGLALRAYVTYGTLAVDCTARQNFMYKSSGDHGYYDEALCERQLTSASLVMAFIVVLRRQRLVSLGALACLLVIANLILALILPMHRTFPAYHWLLLLVSVGMLAFALVVRYSLEVGERRYFETQLRLRSEQQLLEKVSAEDEAFVATLLPAAIINRSARGKAQNIDSADDAVVLVVSVADFANVAGKMLAMDLYTQLRTLHDIALENAEHHGLAKALLLNDELVFVGNMMIGGEGQVLRNSLASIATALACVDAHAFTLALRLRAAVHMGPLQGGFHGGSWIRYDVSGPALDEARAASHHAVAGQVLLTNDVLHVVRDYATTREHTLGEESGDQTLWIVESCLPPQAIEEPASHSMMSPPFESSVTSSNNPTLHCETNSANSLSDHVARHHAAKAAAAVDTELPEESTWLIFHRFVQPEVEAEYLRVRMITMTERATRIWLAFAWLQLVFVIVLMADFFPHSGELALILLLLSIALTLVVALVPTALNWDRMYKYHTPWSLLALLTPLLTTLAIASSRPSALGIDPRPMMMVGALLRMPCLYHERHQLVVIPAFLLLSLSSYLLPGSGLQVFSFPYFAIVLYIIVMSSESDHAKRQNYVAEKQLLFTVDAIGRERQVRLGLVRATLPAPILDAWQDGTLELGRTMATMVPETLCVCVAGQQMADGFTTDRLRPVERAAEDSGVLHIVKVVGDLCVLASPVVLPGEESHAKIRATIAALPRVMRAILELCGNNSSSSYKALMDIDTSMQVLDTSGLPSYSFYGVVLNRLLAVISTTGEAWGGFSTFERNVAVLRETFTDLQLVEKPQPPVRIRGVGQLRLVSLSFVP